MSAAALQVRARTHPLARGDVDASLWEHRSVVKLWAMRGTLHLLPARELPLFVAALRRRENWRRGAWLRYVGVTLEQMEALVTAIGDALDGRQLTRQELADEVARRIGIPAVREVLMSGWGTVLQPAASEGKLCFGPSRGQNVTFVRPDQWIGGWTDVDSDAALREIARRYLACYGPATHEAFARWWGTRLGPARRVFALLGDELVPVDVEGYRALALACDADDLRAPRPAPSLRLVGNFDPYVLHYRPRERLVDDRFALRIFRTAGWISPAILLDGRVVGTWESRRRGGGVQIETVLFQKLPASCTRELDRETALLRDWLNASPGVPPFR